MATTFATALGAGRWAHNSFDYLPSGELLAMLCPPDSGSNSRLEVWRTDSATPPASAGFVTLETQHVLGARMGIRRDGTVDVFYTYGNTFLTREVRHVLSRDGGRTFTAAAALSLKDDAGVARTGQLMGMGYTLDGHLALFWIREVSSGFFGEEYVAFGTASGDTWSLANSAAWGSTTGIDVSPTCQLLSNGWLCVGGDRASSVSYLESFKSDSSFTTDALVGTASAFASGSDPYWFDEQTGSCIAGLGALSVSRYGANSFTPTLWSRKYSLPTITGPSMYSLIEGHMTCIRARAGIIEHLYLTNLQVPTIVRLRDPASGTWS